MKKCKKIFYIMLGGILFSSIGIASAAIITSNDVSYDNRISHSQYNTVKDAIDDLYEKANAQFGYTEEEYNNALSTCPNGNACLKKIRVITGNGKTIGNEIAITDVIDGRVIDEHFYVISSDENSTKLIAKYNLLVGYTCQTSESSSCSLVSSPTGEQSQAAVGYNGVFGSPGTVTFSQRKYWSNTTYPADVYDSSKQSALGNNNYSTAYFINAYKIHLEEILGENKVINARLLTYSEATSLGCDLTTDYSCPEWIGNTTFWLGTAASDSNVYLVSANIGRLYDRAISRQANGGVRPVIEISTSDI